MEQKENKNNSMQDYEDIYQKEKMFIDKAGYNEILQPKTNKEIFNIDK